MGDQERLGDAATPSRSLVVVAVGSFGRASRGPTPPCRPRLRHDTHRRGAASAASRPPQARARAVSKWVPVSAAARGSVSAAAATPSPSDCPRCLPGCQAMFRPPSARQRARTGAAPCLTSLSPRGPPRARACGLLPSLPRPALVPQTALWGWRANYSRACHHTGASSSTGTAPLTPVELEAPIRLGAPSSPELQLAAEFGAAYLCGVCGIANATIDNSAAYLQSWMAVLRHDPQAAHCVPAPGIWHATRPTTGGSADRPWGSGRWWRSCTSSLRVIS